MKTILLFFLFTGTVATSLAQTINYGVKAGLNLSELSGSNTSSIGSSLLAGFNAGVILDIGFQNFSIQPGVFYSTKGEKDATAFAGGGNTNTDFQYLPSKTVLGYIEMPVNLLYKTKVAPSVILNLGGGPYIAYGVSQSLSIQNAAAGQPFGGNWYYGYDEGSGRYSRFISNKVNGIPKMNPVFMNAGLFLGFGN